MPDNIVLFDLSDLCVRKRIYRKRLKAEIGKVLEAGDHPPTLELRRTGRSEGSMSVGKKRKTERQVWIL